MTKKSWTYFLTLLLLTFFISTSDAALINRGNGLIYDDDMNLTWLQYANYANTTMSWDDAYAWADALIYEGYDDWRLPRADECTGYNCNAGEIGHLFYDEGISADSPGDFIDVRSYMYWTSTADSSDSSKAYRFHAGTGYQGTSSKTYKRYAWAVRDGDTGIPVAPEPLSSILFISGGSLFAIRRLLDKF